MAGLSDPTVSKSVSSSSRYLRVPVTISQFTISPFTLSPFHHINPCRYGLVYPGLGWVIWRSKEYLPESIVFHVNYLGSDQASVTLNFSRGAGMIIAQYYQVHIAGLV